MATTTLFHPLPFVELSLGVWTGLILEPYLSSLQRILEPKWCLGLVGAKGRRTCLPGKYRKNCQNITSRNANKEILWGCFRTAPIITVIIQVTTPKTPTCGIMHNQFKTQKFKHLTLAMGPRDLNSAPYSPVHCSSHSMTSFQSSELTELLVVENSQLFAQRTVRPLLPSASALRRESTPSNANPSGTHPQYPQKKHINHGSHISTVASQGKCACKRKMAHPHGNMSHPPNLHPTQLIYERRNRVRQSRFHRRTNDVLHCSGACRVGQLVDGNTGSMWRSLFTSGRAGTEKGESAHRNALHAIPQKVVTPSTCTDPLTSPPAGPTTEWGGWSHT